MVLKKNHLLFLIDNPEKNSSLIGRLHSLENTAVTRIGNIEFVQVKNFLVSHRNCIVVLLIEDKQGDAIDLLYRIHNCSFGSTYVLVIVDMEAGSFVDHIKVHNVSKFFNYNDENYSEDLVIDWINRTYKNLDMVSIFPFFKQYSHSSLRFQIANKLENMGMGYRLKGCKYIIDAIELCCENPNLCITRDVYYILAKRYKTTYSSVDRCMRHAIEVVWRDTTIDCLKSYYPNVERVYEYRPSVSEFVKCIADEMNTIFPGLRKRV